MSVENGFTISIPLYALTNGRNAESVYEASVLLSKWDLRVVDSDEEELRRWIGEKGERFLWLVKTRPKAVDGGGRISMRNLELCPGKPGRS